MAKVERHAIEPKDKPVPAPFGSLPRWMERMDEMLTEPWRQFSPMVRFAEELTIRIPPIDVYEEGADVVVKAELPGMRKEDIEVDVSGDLVTLSGRKEKEEKVERKDYHRLERATGAFTRSVRLPAEVVLEKVTASFKDGVLEIRAPKADAAKITARKVDIA